MANNPVVNPGFQLPQPALPPQQHPTLADTHLHPNPPGLAGPLVYDPGLPIGYPAWHQAAVRP